MLVQMSKNKEYVYIGQSKYKVARLATTTVHIRYKGTCMDGCCYDSLLSAIRKHIAGAERNTVNALHQIIENEARSLDAKKEQPIHSFGGFEHRMYHAAYRGSLQQYIDAYEDPTWTAPEDQYTYILNIVLDLIKQMAAMAPPTTVTGMAESQYNYRALEHELKIVRTALKLKPEHRFLLQLIGGRV